MNDTILLPFFKVFAVLWVIVWLADKAWISYTFLRDTRVPDREPMECPSCGQIEYVWVGEFWHIGDQAHIDEYKCRECGAYGTI